MPRTRGQHVKADPCNDPGSQKSPDPGDPRSGDGKSRGTSAIRNSISDPYRIAEVPSCPTATFEETVNCYLLNIYRIINIAQCLTVDFRIL